MRGRETVGVKRKTEDWQGDGQWELVGELKQCQLWPRSSTEQSDRGRINIEGWNVYAPPGQTVIPTAGDALVIRGEELQIVGSPAEWDMKSRDKGMTLVASRTGE
jgi:hypothetical protein